MTYYHRNGFYIYTQFFILNLEKIELIFIVDEDICLPQAIKNFTKFSEILNLLQFFEEIVENFHINFKMH